MPRKKKNPMLHLPLIPLRGLMVFPHMVLHFDVGRARSVAALEQAMVEDQQVFLVAQRDGDVEEPTMEDFCQVGTVALIKQVLNLPGDTIRVLVEGQQRAILRAVTQEEPFWTADLEVPVQLVPDTPEIQAMVRTTHELFEEYAKASMRIGELSLAIASGNAKRISSIKGVGKKTAEKICVELKDKVSALAALAANSRGGAGDSKAPVIRDAILALTSLGFSEEVANKMVSKVLASDPAVKDAEMLIRLALSAK